MMALSIDEAVYLKTRGACDNSARNGMWYGSAPHPDWINAKQIGRKEKRLMSVCSKKKSRSSAVLF
jgi:hypothetical protein